MRVTSEQVSAGHPDKICDQISDAIVTDCLQHDRNSRVAVECLIKGYDIVIAGEITSKHQPDFRSLAWHVLLVTGLPDCDQYRVTALISQQSPDIALGVDNMGAGDQGMMFGYATNENAKMLPMPFVLATQALVNLRHLRCPSLLPDAKCQVTYDDSNGRIDTFLLSTQHKDDVDLEDVRRIVQGVMMETAEQYGLNTDYKALVNPTGRFVVGGSFADTGVTGRKIIADTYGGACRHGGGAFSGKDPTKVDRSGAYMARKIAKDVLRAGFAKRCGPTGLRHRCGRAGIRRRRLLWHQLCARKLHCPLDSEELRSDARRHHFYSGPTGCELQVCCHLRTFLARLVAVGKVMPGKTS
jgi:S-adenosylmethionine synthetase